MKVLPVAAGRLLQREALLLPYRGYLKNENDSLAMQIYSSFNADLVLVDTRGEHLAAIAFKQQKPEIWIRKDISESYRHAIATLFAVIISIKNY